MDDSRERGLEIFRAVYGEAATAGLVAHMNTDDFAVEIAKWSTDFSFGTVWARDNLPKKLRSCVVLGMMIALRQHEEIAYHTKMGIANGLSRAEIEEILYTAVPYCGFPAANTAKAAMKQAFAQLE
jgi:alkylhydroperoxidase/carboxymuconolactone decarboxylase family protein YurZ